MRNASLVTLFEKILPYVLLLLAAVIIVRTAWLSDDSFITLRESINFTHGLGISWYPGIRIQAFTHPAWFLLLSTMHYITQEYYYSTLIMSFVLTFGAISLLYKHALCHNARLVICCSLLLLLTSKAFIDYTSSGLENPLSYFLCAVMLLAVLNNTESIANKQMWLFYISSALLVLNRLDYILLIMPSVFYYLRTHFKLAWRPALSAVSLVMAWLVFATIYFGAPLPNTFYAKLGGHYPYLEVLAHGIDYYLFQIYFEPATLIIIACGIVSGFITHGISRCFATGILLYLLYIIFIGGDFMQGRFFALLVFNSVFLIQHATLANKLTPKMLLALVLVVISFAVVNNRQTWPLLASTHYQHDLIVSGIADERGFYYSKYGLLSPTRHWPTPIISIKSALPFIEDYKVLCGGVGAAGLTNPPSHYVFDSCGLTDLLLARLPGIPYQDWRVGHVYRYLPTDYFSSLQSGENNFKDPQLKKLYRDILLINSPDLFTKQRWYAIYRFNLSKPYTFHLAKTQFRTHLTHLNHAQKPWQR
ncbi:MAG: hypothetical protein Tsb005_13190 [Gammaproteobacteria bacterium]